MLEKNCNTLISGMQILNIPMLVTEQYSKGIGPTIKSVRNTLGDFKPIEKMSFSCCGESSFLHSLEKLSKKNVILCGIEAHVCVLQTALDLYERGFRDWLNNLLSFPEISNAVSGLPCYRLSLPETAALISGEGDCSILEISNAVSGLPCYRLSLPETAALISGEGDCSILEISKAVSGWACYRLSLPETAALISGLEQKKSRPDQVCFFYLLIARII